MGKNTLKGKAKLLSYFVAFVFMVGIHIAVDKAGAGKEGRGSQEDKEYSGEKNAGVSIAKNQDSLYNEMAGNPELTLLFKN